MESNTMIETKRLKFRRFSQEDFWDLSQILQDPEVVYAYEHTFTDQDVQDWLDRQLKRYQNDGFGLWALIRKDTGEMVGQAGLTWQDCEGEKVLEVGYLLKKRFWHQGYATEAAAACRDYAFSQLKAKKVHSVIKTDNLASIRVAERIGMNREKEFTAYYYNGPVKHFLFSVSRPSRTPAANCGKGSDWDGNGKFTQK